MTLSEARKVKIGDIVFQKMHRYRLIVTDMYEHKPISKPLEIIFKCKTEHGSEMKEKHRDVENK